MWSSSQHNMSAGLFVTPQMLTLPSCFASEATFGAHTTPATSLGGASCEILHHDSGRQAHPLEPALSRPQAPQRSLAAGFNLTLPARTSAYWTQRLHKAAPLLAHAMLAPHLSALFVQLSPAHSAQTLHHLHAAATCVEASGRRVRRDFVPEMLTWLLVGLLDKKAASQYTPADATRVYELMHYGHTYVSYYPMPSARFAQYNALAQFAQASWPAAIEAAISLRAHLSPTCRDVAPTLLDCIYQYNRLSQPAMLLDVALERCPAPLKGVREVEAVLQMCDVAHHLDPKACRSGDAARLRQVLAAAQQFHRPKLTYRAWQQARLQTMAARAVLPPNSRGATPSLRVDSVEQERRGIRGDGMHLAKRLN